MVMDLDECGRVPRVPPWRQHHDTSLPTAVAVVGMKGGQAADLGPNQTRRHIVPALKAGGRRTSEADNRKVSAAHEEMRRTE